MKSSEEYTKSHPDDIEPMEGCQLDTLSELSWPSSSSSASTTPYVSCKGDERLHRIAVQLAEALEKAKSGEQTRGKDIPADNVEKCPEKKVEKKVNMDKVLPQHATRHHLFSTQIVFCHEKRKIKQTLDGFPDQNKLFFVFDPVHAVIILLCDNLRYSILLRPSWRLRLRNHFPRVLSTRKLSRLQRMRMTQRERKGQNRIRRRRIPKNALM